jgi:iron-sulfur cluster insertion protein
MQLTEKAKEKIKEIAESEGIGHCSVRVKIVGSGCSGWTIEMEFDDRVSELDEIIKIDNDIQIIIDPLSYQYINDVKMDYEEGVISSGFRFSDGAIKGTCGCKSSYSF